jgi:hypothetical protein
MKSKKVIIFLLGALLGCFQIGFMFLSSGMGHGISDTSRLIKALYFGYGAFLYFVLPVLQYSVYFYVAYFKLYSAGIRLALVHYLGAVVFIVYSISIRNVDISNVFHDKKYSTGDAIVDLTWFLFLNCVYFKRVLAGRAQLACSKPSALE